MYREIITKCTQILLCIELVLPYCNSSHPHYIGNVTTRSKGRDKGAITQNTKQKVTTTYPAAVFAIFSNSTSLVSFTYYKETLPKFQFSQVDQIKICKLYVSVVLEHSCSRITVYIAHEIKYSNKHLSADSFFSCEPTKYTVVM